MKLLHVADLHIGRKIKGYSLKDDQEFILSQILETAKNHKVKGIIIAGDIYDVSNPSSEAINMFDKFISDIHALGISCYAVSGNHDNIYRVTFGSSIMSNENIYFAKKYSGKIEPIAVDKNTDIWLLPFIRPFDIREYHSDFENGNYEEMMKTVIKNLNINEDKINIFVAHQFITNNGKSPEKSDSELSSLGTLDNIDVSVFDKFDYVALGHIHKPQSMKRKMVRYAGSPLKYSFSEVKDNKSMVLLSIADKQIDLEFIQYKYLRDMKEYIGTYDEILKLLPTDDYVKVILKEDNYIPDIKHKLEHIFPNIMEIIYQNTISDKTQNLFKREELEKQTPLQLFQNFYKQQNDKDMNKEQFEIISEIFKNMEENK